jgi:hypothetical protein
MRNAKINQVRFERVFACKIPIWQRSRFLRYIGIEYEGQGINEERNSPDQRIASLMSISFQNIQMRR